MKLKPRFLLLTMLLFVLSGMAVWVSVRLLAEDIIEQWAIRYAEKQVLYDKSRALQPIIREIALSRQFADSQQIREWARDPDDEALTARAMTEMENFRLNFADRSYFVALLESGRYYHNNADNEYAGREFRYVLDPDKPADSWFYDIIEQQRDMHLNVNPDIPLGVTKLWIDVLLRDGQQILGVVGTGLDLTQFLEKVVDERTPGITSLFVDHQGAIQLYRDQSLIDFATISSNGNPQNGLERLFERPSDRTAVRAAMQELETLDSRVITRFVHVEDKRYLAGIAYIPEIDWYEITLLDLEVLLPFSLFGDILLVYGATLLIALLLFNLMLGRSILRPLERLAGAMRQVEKGDYSEQSLPPARDDEIGRLVAHFRTMRQSVQESRHSLEEKVRERTEALDHLTKTDPLTELLNRRGMTERLEAEISRAGRNNSRFGIVWLDLDRFKDINDQHGHKRGDEALIKVSRLIRSIIRPYDSAARWGGDEFLMLLQQCDGPALELLSERIRAAVATSCHVDGHDGIPVPFSISAGTYLYDDGDDLETILLRADLALYEAKEGGRNRVSHYRQRGPVRLQSR